MAAERRLTVSEASRLLGMSRTTLLAAEEAGLLTPMRTPGGHRRYSPAALRRYAAEAGGGPLDAADQHEQAPTGIGRAASGEIAAKVRVTVRPLVQAIDADTAGLYLLDGPPNDPPNDTPNDPALRFAGGFGVPRWLAERLTAGPTPAPVMRALQTPRPCPFDPAAARFPEPRSTGQGFTTALRHDGGRPLGVLFVVTRHDLLPGETRFVSAFGDALAMLVENEHRILDLQTRLARIATLSTP